jgi:hypothetical protein
MNSAGDGWFVNLCAIPQPGMNRIDEQRRLGIWDATYQFAGDLNDAYIDEFRI